jgi:hypothetical protein
VFIQLLRAIELELLYSQHAYLSRRAFALVASGLFSATFDDYTQELRHNVKW